MLKFALPSVFVLAIGMTLSVPSLAEEPVPAAKPLQVPGNTRFVEGVDVPPRKPVPEKSAKASAKQERVEKAACDLAGAVFEIRTPISGEQSGDAGCGIEEPVAVTAIETGAERVNFRGTVTISCDFAKIVTDWVRSDVLSISEKHFDARIETIATGPGYQCRRRNNQPDGKLSEHALGKAIDISGFRLSDDTFVSVEKDWGEDTKKGRFLKAIHASACKRFTTVLSPEGDAFHQSHLHLDIGCHGKDCTYLICQ